MSSRKLWDPKASAADHLVNHLAAACDALAMSQDLPKFENALRVLIGTWGTQSVREIPPSYILSAEGTPAEFSLVSDQNHAAVRLAVQSYLDGPATGELARFRGFLEELSRGAPLDLALFDRLSPWLDRGKPQFGFQCEFRAGGQVPFKVYASVADFEVYADILNELGVPEIAERIRGVFDPEHDTCTGVAIPLGERPHCQLYVNHRGPVVERMKRFAELGSGVVWSDLEQFLSCLLDTTSERVPDIVRNGFTKIYVPVQADAKLRLGGDFQMRKYLFMEREGAVNDGEFLRRMSRIFDIWNIPSEAYRNCVHAFARASLDREFLIHDAFGYLERVPGERQIVTYLSPRMFAYQPDRLKLAWDVSPSRGTAAR